ncbi:MAG: hypothetical protein L0323_22175 [Planctomycetes bacterium]|nr:hypothetical protein [Planctomycetota bacterium]
MKTPGTFHGLPPLRSAAFLVLSLSPLAAARAQCDEIREIESPDDYAWFGTSVSGAGDLDGDGLSDFLVGAPYASPGGIPEAGEVIAFSGADGSLLLSIPGLSFGEGFGRSVAPVGDVDGDSVPDLIAGAAYAFSKGRASVHSGASGALLFNFVGRKRSDFGWSVAGAGDVNGDGRGDFLVGAPFSGVGGKGFARIHSGLNGKPLRTLKGKKGSRLFGWSVARVGDVDGDGSSDVAVGARDALFYSGQVTLFSGKRGKPLLTFVGGLDDGLGCAVAGPGDVNGDGVPDLLAGAWSRSGEGMVDNGRAILFSGLDGSTLRVFDGDSTNAQFGWSVAGPGDVNGDLVPDLFVGAHAGGYARLFSGADGSALCTIVPGALSGLSCVAGAGDADGDGRADVILGIPQPGSGGVAEVHRYEGNP